MRSRALLITALAALSPLILESRTTTRAQSIVPASDGTGTVVTIDGNRFTIDGGALSSDGANLFHSFQQFGLDAPQVAEFLSQPQIRNVLARVVGGDRSFINGLIELTGGNSNLYLLNPAGIVFGANASLNVPSDFFATTATGIGFGADRWFETFGDNDYAALVGTPAQFAFDLARPGRIVNAGNLTLSPGQNLTLLGGSVLNAGTLATAGGNILVSAVPGASTVRISQPGHLLSLEIQPPRDRQGNVLPFGAIELPELLTGVAGLTALGNEQVQLNDSGTVAPFTVETVLASGLMDAAEMLGQGGTVHVLGENVALLDQARVDVSGDTGGGLVRLGGDYLGNGTVPNAQYNFGGEAVTIQADARMNGDGGTVIVWADEATRFYGNISARGGQNGGDGGLIETSGKHYLDVAGAAIDASAPLGDAGEWLLDPRNVTIANVTSGGTFSAGIFTPTSDNATVNVTDILNALALGLNVTIATGSTGNQAGDITVASPINPITYAGNVTLTLIAADDIFVNADIVNGDMTPSDTFNVALIAGGDINTTNATISTAKIIPSSGSTVGGSIAMQAGGAIATGNLSSRAETIGDGDTTGGSVNLQAGSAVTTGNVDTGATTGVDGDAIGGNISMQAGSTLATGSLNASADVVGTGDATGGKVNLTSGDTPGNTITFASIDTSADAPGTNQGGDVALAAYGLVRGTRTLSNGNTIDTFGATASGTIDITHDGGFDNVPFTVGSATTNGTVGGLRGANQLSTGSFPVLPNGGLAAGIPAGIRITSINNPPTFSFDGTSFVATDVDLDNLTLSFELATSGGLTLVASDGVSSASTSLGFGAFTDFRCLPTCGTETSATSSENLRQTGLLDEPVLDPGVEEIEAAFTAEFVEYFGLDPAEVLTLTQVREALQRIAAETETNPAIVYVLFSAAAETTGDRSSENLYASTELWRFSDRDVEAAQTPNDLNAGDMLQLVLVTPRGDVVVQRLPAATRERVLEQAARLRRTVTNFRRPTAFLPPARQMYQWMIAPLAADLQKHNVDNIIFVLHPGLRSLPMAALHDGEQFLIEQYGVSLMPSLSLADTAYRDIKTASVLAMGASEFPDQSPLPAVPLELEAIDQFWDGAFFLNEEFTLARLKGERQQDAHQIVHLGTHGEFRAGKPEQSYIAFGDRRLSLDRLPELNLSDPIVELLVLSACRTALGDREAELGFAGLAVIAGVKSALGSLWLVDDTATFALMGSFYERLRDAPIKVEALRQAQLALLRGETRLADGNLFIADEAFPLTPDLSTLGERDFQHPYFWSGFTLIGSPW